MEIVIERLKAETEFGLVRLAGPARRRGVTRSPIRQYLYRAGWRLILLTKLWPEKPELRPPMAGERNARAILLPPGGEKPAATRRGGGGGRAHALVIGGRGRSRFAWRSKVNIARDMALKRRLASRTLSLTVFCWLRWRCREGHNFTRIVERWAPWNKVYCAATVSRGNQGLADAFRRSHFFSLVIL